MPASALPRFYNAYRDGLGDFINGSRLVYGTESGAMRALNTLGNVLFAKALSRVLSVRLGDSLCGTKVVCAPRLRPLRRVAPRFSATSIRSAISRCCFPRRFSACRWSTCRSAICARTYGETNISRFRHGWMLLKMTAIGFVRVRLGIVS